MLKQFTDILDNSYSKKFHIVYIGEDKLRSTFLVKFVRSNTPRYYLNFSIQLQFMHLKGTISVKKSSVSDPGEKAKFFYLKPYIFSS